MPEHGRRTSPICQDMKVGKTRTKLAQLIEEKLPGVTVDPSKLYVNRGANVYNDGVSWDGWGKLDGWRNIHLHSWERMTDLVKGGISLTGSEHEGYELHIKA
jgi:hypothetical protein